MDGVSNGFDVVKQIMGNSYVVVISLRRDVFLAVQRYNRKYGCDQNREAFRILNDVIFLRRFLRP